MEAARAPPSARPQPAAAGSAWRRRALVAVVVVLIIALVVVAPRVRDHERALGGYWVADSSFLEESGLSEMCLYLPPRARRGGRWYRDGYLVMVGGGGEPLADQAVAVSWPALGPARWASAVRSHFAPPGGSSTYRVPAAEFAYTSGAPTPERMELTFDATRGALALQAEGRLYAYLFRDNETSVAADAEYGAGEYGAGDSSDELAI
jgi:hypothetical protein